MAIRLYSYWRSSAAYRVRIALNLKSLEHDIVPVSLAPGVAEHRSDAYRARNPQMLVPFLEDGDIAIGQSMAMLEYLEEAYPDVRMLPEDQPQRARVRAFCNAVACDIHPILNLRVLQYIKSEFGHDPQEHWYAHWIHTGFQALEAQAEGGPFVFGNTPTFADAVLIPQMYNAHRFNIALGDYPKLNAIEKHCNSLDAFKVAMPEQQADAS
tara:strand:+ start:7865 stop:8497 length:633 start_codon:yes stop_codon:yes gene_type:complete